MKAFEPFKKYDYEYPEEMEKILNYLQEHGKFNVSGKTIESLYYDFSDERYDAIWMVVSADWILEKFADYLSDIEI